MTEALSTTSTAKDMSCLLGVLQSCFETCKIDLDEPVLVLGGGQEDLDILTACGFKQIVMSNIGSAGLALDAEDIALPDDSYPVVFAHAVLHHCRSPHKAVGEMVRVAKKHVFFLEPNDSWALSLLVRLKLSFPYELAAVVAHDYVEGGMRNGPIPNYIYRWTGHEVEKCVAVYHPERGAIVRPYPYWDFYVNLARRESRVASMAKAIGPSSFVKLHHAAQVILNLLPLRAQGNKLFCAISKGELHPWIGGNSGIDSEWLPLYQAFGEVTAVNLDPSPDPHPLPHVRRMVGDGCCLPFADGSFEWAFSNAVIEHAGGRQHQERFAKEVQRVASRGYFVTTPNKYFPIEPHAMLPFCQFLPVFLQKKVAPYSPGYLWAYEEINLLSVGQMRALFPGAPVLAVGFPILGNSIVAYNRKEG